jgi:hypothetical protein
MGRASAVRQMLSDVQAMNEVFQDDQMMFVRYMLEHSHLVSVDQNRMMSATGYRECPDDYFITYLGGYRHASSLHSIGILHCNSHHRPRCINGSDD